MNTALSVFVVILFWVAVVFLMAMAGVGIKYLARTWADKRELAEVQKNYETVIVKGIR